MTRDQPESGATRAVSGAAGVTSVVIVNFNGRHHLEKCLPALFATESVAIEVILVDNASADDSVAWVTDHFPSVHVQALDRNAGFGEANRRGAVAAAGETIAFLNSDTVVEPGWLAPLVRALELDSRIAAACSTLRLLHHPELLNARGGGMTRTGYGFDHEFMFPYEPPSAPGAMRDVLFPTAAAMVMRKAEFLECGAFDPAFFMYHEDVDLGWRLWLLGRRVVVCDDSVVYHAFLGTSRSEKGLEWRARLGLRHNLRTLLKHYEFGTFMRAFKSLIRVLLLQRAYLHIARMAAWNLLYLGSTLRERRRLQARRVVSDDEFVRRGLISPAPMPAPPPAAPHLEGRPIVTDLIRSPELAPGHPSAQGRLGYGWYAPEFIDGVVLRRTCGRARCCLRVAPLTPGDLRLKLRLPAAVPGDRTVSIQCNGLETRLRLTTSEWRETVLPVSADEDGILDIEIASSTWIPHPLAANWDFRRLGCDVREMRFVARATTPRREFHSISVIIPTYNRWPHLALTLAALEAQTMTPFEVIVVDDGSTDDTWERLRAWGAAHPRLALKTVRQVNLKQGRARNTGLAHAVSDLVLFLGDDIVPAPDCLAQHLAAHNRLGAGHAVAGFTDWHRALMRVTPFLEFINTDGAQFSFGLLTDGGEAPFTCFYTSNVSLERELLGSEPFRREFTSYGWEDIELGYRLSEQGVRIVYFKAARARHIHPTSVSSFLARQRHVGATIHRLYEVQPALVDNPYLPPQRSPRRYRLLRPVYRALSSGLAVADVLGVRMPRRFYRDLLNAAFYEGALAHARAARRAI